MLGQAASRRPVRFPLFALARSQRPAASVAPPECEARAPRRPASRTHWPRLHGVLAAARSRLSIDASNDAPVLAMRGTLPSRTHTHAPDRWKGSRLRRPVSPRNGPRSDAIGAGALCVSDRCGALDPFPGSSTGLASLSDAPSSSPPSFSRRSVAVPIARSRSRSERDEEAACVRGCCATRETTITSNVPAELAI